MSRLWEFAHLSDNWKDFSACDKIPRAGSLFIGGLAAFDREPSPLKAAGVTHVVSVLEYDIKDRFNLEGYARLWAQVDDYPDENLLCHLTRTTKFIDEALTVNGSVFVHCAMGVSRSATVVCAYLMWKHNISAQQALEQLREGRQRCQPNPGFMDQLRVYENILNARSKADANSRYEKWVRQRYRDNSERMDKELSRSKL